MGPSRRADRSTGRRERLGHCATLVCFGAFVPGSTDSESPMGIGIGIDIGSVGVKAALFTTRPEDLPLLEGVSAGPRSPRPGRSVTVARAGSAWPPTRGSQATPGARRASCSGGSSTTSTATRSAAWSGPGPARGRSRRTSASSGPTSSGSSPAPRSCCCPRSTPCSRSGARTRGTCASTGSGGTAASASPTTARTATAPPARARSSTSRPAACASRWRTSVRSRCATPRAAQIAGRCSVFAKSDMIHAQQRGFTPEEILNGLCDAVARNFRSSITKGRAILPAIALVGGVASNAGVVRSLEQAFGWQPGSSAHPARPGLVRRGGRCLPRPRAQRLREDALALVGAPGAASEPFATSPPLSMERVMLLRDRLCAVEPAPSEVPVDAYLGIDIGSVSTNLVVIDPAGEVLKEIYLRTNARPVEAVANGLRDIEQTLGSRIRIRGVGTTGSGRELIAELVGADTTRDEITAHKTGAAFIDKTLLGLGVDTIFEIGGQDAKFISLEDGIVVDFTMNEACAAGHRQLPRGARAGAGHPDRGRVRGPGALQPQPGPPRRALHRVHGARRQRLPAAGRRARGRRRRARVLRRDELRQPRRARPPASARRSSSRAAPPTTTPSPPHSAPSSGSGSSSRRSTA